MKKFLSCLFTVCITFSAIAQTNNASLEFTDIPFDKDYPASMIELAIPSAGSKLQGFMYKAAGKGYHPTLFLLHGFPGNERNLDLAQLVRSKGWNVLYFNYRGAWGSQGQFSFKNCVEDVVNAVHYIKQEKERLKVDVNHLVLFGHSMGGWVTLKAVQQLPEIKKAFVLSTWDIPASFKGIQSEAALMARPLEEFKDVFVLNTSYKNIITPIIVNPAYYDLAKDATQLAGKQIVVLDEHRKNEHIVNAIKKINPAAVEYLIWETDHSFTNKRASLIHKVLSFLDKDQPTSQEEISSNEALHQPIIGFFDGLSLIREDLLFEHTTKDFVLLEAGMIWNNDTLINRIRPLKNTNFERKNSFTFLSTKQQGDVAWVSYWNQATINRNGKSSTPKWLESVVLVRQSGRWKIQSMHSTPMKQ